MERSICIISFSPIYRDTRVLRQIKYLSNHYDLNVIGYGEPHSCLEYIKNINWHFVEIPKLSYVEKFIEVMFLTLAGLRASFYNYWYWRKRNHRVALKMAISSKCDAYHANDWEALPVAAEAAKRNNARIVFDAHEYAPLEFENRLYWKVLFRPAIIYFMKKYTSQIKVSLTVAPLISERYKREFGLDAIVVLNAPEKVTIPDRALDFNDIRLIHHGGAIRDRRLESMIETLTLCERRFSLHFMLTNNDVNYLNYLKKLARKMLPSRVIFHEPVPSEEIVKRISEYDIGFCLIAPTNYNYFVSLPNKFFDYIMAGLAVCIGPSPSMGEVVRKYGCGCIASSFDPTGLAEVLNRLTAEDLKKMRLASRKAAEEINAQKEMNKLVDLYDQLLNSH